MQALLTMLFFSALTGGNPPLFMDFRKVWEPWELEALAKKLGFTLPEGAALGAEGPGGRRQLRQRLVRLGGQARRQRRRDHGQASACRWPIPATSPAWATRCTFVSPGGLEGIAGRLDLQQPVRHVQPELGRGGHRRGARTAGHRALPDLTTADWPHTFVVPKYATMGEYKHYPPANHFHMIQGLSPARLEYWMDLNNVLSTTPWAARPSFIEGVDRPIPLLYLANGGETNAKLMLGRK